MGNKKKVGILSLAKLQAILFSILGFVVGFLYSLGGAVYDLFTTGLNSGTLIALAAMIGMPLLFLITGFVLGVLEALLYNSIFINYRFFDLKID